MRALAELARASLALGALAQVVAGRPAAAWAMALVAILAFVPRWLSVAARPDAVFTALLAADAWLTALGVVARIDRHDTIGHVVLPAAAVPVALHAVRRLAPEWAWLAAVIAAAAAIMGAGIAWEVVEYASDAALGTDMSLGAADTRHDLVGDASGALIGATLVAVRARLR